MSRRKPSVTAMAIAESEKKTGEQSLQTKTVDETKKHFSVKFLLLIVSVILVAGAIFGAYYLYSMSALAPIPTVSTLPVSELGASLMGADYTVKIPVSGLNASTLISRVRNEVDKSQAPGTIKEIIFTTTTGDKTTRLDAPQMLELMNIDVPSNIKRSLDKDWMLGVYTSRLGYKSVFVISTNNFFQNTFAGMLAWEQYMPESLKPYIFSPKVSTPTQDDNASSTTPSNQTSNSSDFTMRGRFIDRIFSNRDVREYINENDKILFLYSFIDSSRLVITSDEDTLAEILKRLEK